MNKLGWVDWNWVVLGAATLVFVPAAGCGPGAPPAKEAPVAAPAQAYQPNFSYKSSATSGEKLDVTLGLVLPGAAMNNNQAGVYLRTYQSDDVVKGMLVGMGTSLNEVLIAKGFTTRGPFPSLNEMTHPDKQGSDLLLYPEFDFSVELATSNVVAPAAAPAAAPAKPSEKNTVNVGDLFGGSGEKEEPAKAAAPTKPTCDVTISVVGKVTFVAQEPITGERMWIKSLDVSVAKQKLAGKEGAPCPGADGDWNVEVHDAWAKIHEVIFQNSMKALDTYVDGSQFKTFKAGAQELRAKKSY